MQTSNHNTLQTQHRKKPSSGTVPWGSKVTVRLAGSPCRPMIERHKWAFHKAGRKVQKLGRHGPGESLACIRSSKLPEAMAMRRTAPRLDLMALSLNGLQQPCSRNTPSQPNARALQVWGACAQSEGSRRLLLPRDLHDCAYNCMQGQQGC